MGQELMVIQCIFWNSHLSLWECVDAVNRIGTVVVSWQAGLSRLLALCFLAILACSFVQIDFKPPQEA